jgi:2-C-methyl-D-erythritol 4-phosphate cytidylyltransferase
LPGDCALKVAAVIPAAGFGTRMEAGLSKQFLSIEGKPVLYYTLSVFENSPFINEIVVVLSREDRKLAEERIFSRFSFKKISFLVDGGSERKDSVYNGLKAVSHDTDYVVIHDGCRPFVTDGMIEKSLSAAKETGGAIVAVPLRDTLKKENQGFIEKTVSREGLWQAQTPQTFRYHLLLQAYQGALENRLSVTDDAMLLEQLGLPVKMVPGSLFNIKITLPEDLVLAEMILTHRKEKRK